MKAGTYWYRMEMGGQPQGYARIDVTARAGGGVDVAWEMKLGFPDSSYEERRSMSVDGELKLLSASYHSGERLVSEAKRNDDSFVGRAVPKGAEELVDIDEAMPADAATGVLFALAAFLPQSPGATLERNELNEADAFRPFGRCVFTCEERESLDLPDGPLDAWRIVLDKHDDTRMTIWISEAREVARVDWGGDVVQLLSRESTEHLFTPPKASPADS